jgi:predicted glycogen debranching enzyme
MAKAVAKKKASSVRNGGAKKSVSKESSVPNMKFGADVCGDPERALTLEWLETNGIGGFASSTILGANTRRYHGLLVAALQPPAGRIVALSKIEETISAPGGLIELSTNRYPGALHPMGYELLESFNLDPLPRWIFKVGNYYLEKTLLLEYGANTVWIRYRYLGVTRKPIKCPKGYELSARPMLAFRDYHYIGKRNDYCNLTAEVTQGGLTLKPYEGLPEMHVGFGGIFEPAPDWYYNFEYDIERERGLDFAEDLFSPGTIKSPIGFSEWVLSFSSEHGSLRPEGLSSEFYRLFEIETGRRKALFAGFEKSDEATRRLAVTADSFIVRRGNSGKTVIAGYHWFTDWGRDTMISLPGLTLATGRFEIAREILTTFAKHIRYGLVPNRFPDEGETPCYNSVDAALWYVLAVDSYIKLSGDSDILKEVWGPLMAIVGGFRQGTLNDIFMDEDGLISAGSPGSQLTWMDAKVGDWVVTPRHGKAVEINAMWYNSLLAMAGFAERLGADTSMYSQLAALVKCEFESQFWNEENGCLYDVLRPGYADAAIRPNQVFALSLQGELLSAEKRESVLKVVEEKLLTPYGLRSLAPGDQFYRWRYEGGVIERDGAYHQGTVWAWLMGPFISALWNVRGKTPATKRYAAGLLEKLEAHLFDTGLNSVSEIFDGEAPHHPRGCISQAWSVSELLRIKKEINE